MYSSSWEDGPMTRRAALQAIPLLLQELIFIGIDVGKTKHVAGFVSTTLLQRHQRFEGCPGATDPG